jgi:hypothetical protein
MFSNRKISHLIFILSALTACVGNASANLLSNPGFETGSSFPDNWMRYGSGVFIWHTATAHTGNRCMELGGSSFSLMFQRVAGLEGRTYTASVWAKSGSADANATLKLEFHDASQTEIIQYWLPFIAVSEWTEFSVTKISPPNTAFVTASIVGETGGTILFDDVSLVLHSPIKGDIDSNGLVNWADLSDFAEQWLADGCVPFDWCNNADVTQNGQVNLSDFALVAQNWLIGLPNILGVTHVDGKYYFGTEDFLNEGADRILALGSRVIKVWFVKPAASYPYSWNSSWPDTNSLVELAQTPYFQQLFDKPFTTYILMAFSYGHADNHFINGITGEEKLDEQRQFYELAKYLLTTYQNTGKTFIIQHWEGDWLIRGHWNPDVDPTPTAIAGMIEWLNARQAGVNQARQEVGQHGVRVYHAAEVNIVLKSMNEGRPNVVNRVLPFTNLDLVSYSSWDSTVNYIGQPEVLKNALDFIAANMPDSPDFGSKNVYLGEYGLPANEYTQAQLQSSISGTTQTALEWGCPYVVFWQLYCNELAASATPPVHNNADVRGFWLIKPDGTFTWTWNYFYKLLNP